MPRSKEKVRWPLAAGIILIIGLLLGIWLFGWFRGSLDLIDLDADAVERIELSCTDTTVGEIHTSVVTQKEDIQSLIDSINNLKHTGSSIKLLRYGIGLGGSVHYSVDIYPLDGEKLRMDLFSHSETETGEQEMSYYWCDNRPLIPDTCRGSMAVFYRLYVQ